MLLLCFPLYTSIEMDVGRNCKSIRLWQATCRLWRSLKSRAFQAGDRFTIVHASSGSLSKHVCVSEACRSAFNYQPICISVTFMCTACKILRIGRRYICKYRMVVQKQQVTHETLVHVAYVCTYTPLNKVGYDIALQCL